jgi:RNA-directed DNA polymerase
MNHPRVQSAVHKAEHLGGPEFVAEVRVHAGRHEKLLMRLRNASAKENAAEVKKVQRLILNSHSSKVACLVRSLKKTSNFTPASILATAKALDAWKDCGEPIKAWAEMKSSGKGWRPVCSFGPKRKALQTLVADTLSAKFGNEPFDYLVKGKGAEAASDRIVELIDAGRRFFVLADIENFYRSVQHGYVREATGLPPAVVMNSVLISPHASLSLYGDLPSLTTLDTFDGAVRSGLPQGSRISPIIASLLLGPALGKISSTHRIVFYGDDCAIAAHDEAGANALSDALAGILKSHPAGPFRLKRSDIVHANDGFNFLQYRHRLDFFTQKVRRHPSQNSYRRYERKVFALAYAFPPVEAKKSIDVYRSRWMNSFRRWPWNVISNGMLYLTTIHAMNMAKQLAMKKAKASTA